MQIIYNCKSFQLLKTKILICTGNHHRKLRYEMCTKSIWVPFWAIDLVMLTARLRLCYTLGFTHLEALYVELIGTTNWPTERQLKLGHTTQNRNEKNSLFLCLCQTLMTAISRISGGHQFWMHIYDLQNHSSILQYWYVHQFQVSSEHSSAVKQERIGSI